MSHFRPFLLISTRVAGTLATSMKLILSLAFIVDAATAWAQTSETERKYALTFLSHRSGYNQIYTSHADGSKPQPFFGGPIKDVPSFDKSYTMFREPHWTRQSPNGEYFASWVYETGKPYSKFQGSLRPMLVVGDIRGSWTRNVNPDCHEEFAWSPDSNKLAFSIFSKANYQGSLQNRPVTTEVFTSGIDGANLTCVFEQAGQWIVLDWSPDGERLLISRQSFNPKPSSELFEFKLHQAFEDKQKANYDPAWATKTALKYLQKIDLGLPRLIFHGARYSPTRNELAIEVCDPENMFAPNLVPDESDELGRNRMLRVLGKIYVFDMETKAHRKVADYDDGIRGPICWSPDGNDVYFSRYLPRDDDREKSHADKEHGLSIWAVGRQGKNDRFITTGWSPDFPHTGPKVAK
jgi:hypothetical protein